MSGAGDPVIAVVNGERVCLSDLVKSMGVGDESGLFERCARRRLVAQLAEREGLQVGPEALQAAVDAWRYGHRLERVADTEAWLKQRGITLCDVAAEVEYGLLEEGLAQRVTGGRIEPYFAQHTLDFDEAEVCWICVADEGAAEEIFMQAAEDGGDFHDFARRFSEDGATRPAGGYLGRVRRARLPKGVAPLIFAADPGSVVGPVKVAKGFALYLVQQVFPAALTASVRREIRARLFEAWLAREMRQAEVAFPFLEALKQAKT